MTEKRYYFVGEKSKQNQAVIELVELWRSGACGNFKGRKYGSNSTRPTVVRRVAAIVHDLIEHG